MKKIGSLLSYVGVALFVGIGITQCIEVSKSMPDNAVVYADDEPKIYHAPNHFIDDKVGIPVGLRKTTAIDVQNREYRKDVICADREYFSYERGSLLKSTLSDWTGLAGPSRWNEDGSWNW